jgi:hypothetical protein
VRIAPGELGATVPVTVLPDEVEEPEETFEVRVVAAVHARVVRGEAVVTVTPPVSPRPDGDEPTD